MNTEQEVKWGAVVDLELEQRRIEEELGKLKRATVVLGCAVAALATLFLIEALVTAFVTVEAPSVG